MRNKVIHAIVFVCGIITFIIPFIQLSIGFHYVVKDGQSANLKCSAAPDLPLLMAIGGIFALFFLGTAYGLLHMLSSINNQQSDIAGKIPRILVGLVSFTFGSITLIFFILIQIRVYHAYSNTIQYDTPSTFNFCQSTVMRGGLVSIILTYINFLLFIAIYILALLNGYYQRREQHSKEFQMKIIAETIRF